MARSNKKFTVPAKRQIVGKTGPEHLTIIILAAGPGKRMRSYGSRSLLYLGDGETLISHQLKVLQEVFPLAETIVVVGFEADRVLSVLPKTVRAVENENFEDTNVVRSMAMGLHATPHNNVLIVYGDLVFNADSIKNTTYNGSCIVVDSKNQLATSEVGVTIVDNMVTHFSYGLAVKWGQIVYLTGRELELMRNIAGNRNKSKLYGFEALNEILNKGGAFRAVEDTNSKITEIDSHKDITQLLGR